MRIRICPRCSSEIITLTARRRQLLELIASGLADKEIAEKLQLTPSTVHSEIQQIYSDIGHGNRVKVALWWDRFKRKNPDLFGGAARLPSAGPESSILQE